MGNSLYILGSLSLINLTQSFISPEREKQLISSIEERCTNIDSFFSFEQPSHSYLVLTTNTGERIRIDYNAENIEPSITYDYYEIIESEKFRFSKVNQELTVSQAVNIARKHCVKKKYCIFSHNCQHVARDTFCEITGTRTSLIRNDFLDWLKRTVPKQVRSEMDDFKDIERNFEIEAEVAAKTGSLSYNEFFKKNFDMFENTRGFTNWDIFKKLDITEYLRMIGKTKEDIENFTNIWGKGLNITFEELKKLAEEMEKYEK